MKLNKTNKLLFILSILALTLILVCSSMSFHQAKADGTETKFTFDDMTGIIVNDNTKTIIVAKDYKYSTDDFAGTFDGNDESINLCKNDSCFGFYGNYTIDSTSEELSFSGDCTLTITQDSKTATFTVKAIDKLFVLKSNAFNVTNEGTAGNISLVNAFMYSYSTSTGLYGNYYYSDSGSNKSASVSFKNDTLNFVDDEEKDITFNKNDSYVMFEINNDNKDKATGKIEIYDKDYDEEEAKVVATYDLTVFKDTEAPKYDKDKFDKAFDTYKANIEKALKDGETYVQLGSGKTITLPSMKEFISDNVSPYDKLNYKVYYKNKNTTEYTAYQSSFTSTSSIKLEVKTPGTYYFYVIFEDANGNAMEVEGEDESAVIKGTTTKISDITFSFEIYENHKFEVTASEAELSDGFVNTKYTAGTSIFTADDCTATYTLKYSATQDGTYSELSEDDADEVDFSTSDLSFTPNKIGYYKIECYGKSTSTGLVSDTVSKTIYIGEEATVVDVPSAFETWVGEHVLAVVFLGIGLLCLAGIIVLLFIKPKEPTVQNDKVLEDKKN